jgi:hypothetical protein
MQTSSPLRERWPAEPGNSEPSPSMGGVGQDRFAIAPLSCSSSQRKRARHPGESRDPALRNLEGNLDYFAADDALSFGSSNV